MHEQIAEERSVLAAIIDAKAAGRKEFVSVELGCGYGQWIGSAGVIILYHTSVAVEACLISVDSFEHNLP